MKTQSQFKIFFRRALISTAIGLFSLIAVAEEGSVIGKWKTIDDATGKAKSIVEIFKEGEVFKGRIAELIDPEEANPVCKECTDEKKGKPIQGLEIMWGIKEAKPGQEWSGGKILDPKNGKTYNCRLRLLEKGKKLEVRGFIGISLFGRSQTWLREPNVLK